MENNVIRPNNSRSKGMTTTGFNHGVFRRKLNNVLLGLTDVAFYEKIYSNCQYVKVGS